MEGVPLTYEARVRLLRIESRIGTGTVHIELRFIPETNSNIRERWMLLGMLGGIWVRLGYCWGLVRDVPSLVKFRSRVFFLTLSEVAQPPFSSSSSPAMKPRRQAVLLGSHARSHAQIFLLSLIPCVIYFF